MLRRFAACVLALVVTTSVARASSVLCINVPEVVTLTDSAGNELIGNGRFDEIFTVREGELYAAGSQGAYHLFNVAGEQLSGTGFSMIDDQGNALIFRSGGFCGAMDAAGRELLPAEWTQLIASEDGGWLALKDDPLDETPDEVIHIDASGTAMTTGVYTASGLMPMSCGRMPFMDGDGLWGAVTSDGSMAIEPAWQYLGPFVDGVAKVSGPKGSGMIDVRGRPVIPATYLWIDRSTALVAAFDGNGVDVYGPRGGQRRYRLRGSVNEIMLIGNRVAVADPDGVNLYNDRGRLLLKSSPGTSFAQGTQGQLIACNGEWGQACQRLVDPDGSVGSARFQMILPLCPGRYTFMEMDGIEYYSLELERIQQSWDYEDRCYGLMDARGRILLEAEYYDIRALSEDRLLLVGNGEVLLADRNGVELKRWATTEREGPIGEAGE